MEFVSLVKEQLVRRIHSNSGGVTQQDLESWGVQEVQLRPHQLDGVTWLTERCSQSVGCILGDEMGLGKTLQVSQCVHTHTHTHTHRRRKLGGGY